MANVAHQKGTIFIGEEIALLLAEIKEHQPLAVEVMSLEAELMKVQQPYLFI